jgi:hypothetical protein
MYNCIYDDNTSLPLPTGPCPPFNDAGAAFVDSYLDETVVDVIEPLEPETPVWVYAGMALLVAVALMGRKGR